MTTLQKAWRTLATTFAADKKSPQGEMISVPVYELQQLHRFAELGRLSSGILHDLANPLTTVTLSLEDLQNGTDSPHIERAIKGTETMQLYVRAARSHIGGQDSDQRFTIRHTIDNIEQMTAYKARQLNVSLKVDCQVDLSFYGNPIRFQQVLTNLVSNAIDSYRDCEAVDRIVQVSIVDSHNRLVITVTDHGCGISNANLLKIFEPFYTTKTLHHGTGIGLAITKDIIEKEFGGKIRVKSKAGDGTTFRLTLPKKHEKMVT
jgi:two-component system NtrC family sensor kinase